MENNEMIKSFKDFQKKSFKELLEKSTKEHKAVLEVLKDK